MNYKKILNLRNVIIVGIILIAILFIYNKVTFLEKTVIKNRDKWDLLAGQNTLLSGEFMGFMYEEDYDINTIPSQYLFSLVVDNYIDNDSTFYDDSNMNDEFLYEKKVTVEEINDTLKRMFGPDFQTDIQEVRYGCGRELRKEGDVYVISSYFPDACGLFSIDAQYYSSNIVSYYRDNKDIVIELRVGYIETVLSDEDSDEEEAVYNIYTNKSKDKLIKSNADISCLSEESADSTCYDFFQKFKVILKKASDGKYYFYKISKVD